jgi:hypothetical protein
MKAVHVILISTLFACTTSPAHKFNKLGISFNCPEGWSITDEDNIDDKGYYISIEKQSLDASGLMAVSWVNDSLDLNDDLELYKNEFLNNVIYKHADLQFENSFQTKFNTYNSVALRFTASILSVKHDGIIYAFYGNGKTITVVKQEAIEDRSDNEAGFATLENSFVVD